MQEEGRILTAIDPGPEKSAILCYNPESRAIETAEIIINELILNTLPPLSRHGDSILAIEMIASYGMPVGKDVFETCVWIGRFQQAWSGFTELLYRRDVKLHLCDSPRAKDANIRQALIDRFGPGKDRAIGKKASPGPLYGIKADLWAALGVAVTVADALEGGSPRGLDCRGRAGVA
jgi:hypothetical protein